MNTASSRLNPPTHLNGGTVGAVMGKLGGEPLDPVTAGGTSLVATVYSAAGPDWKVVGSATVVPRGLYRRFAESTKSRGVCVPTLDYGGIGGARRRRRHGRRLQACRPWAGRGILKTAPGLPAGAAASMTA